MAELLGKSVAEILEMTQAEYMGWVVYFEEKKREQEKQEIARHAKAEAKKHSLG